jgi:preprotein translocase subunit SecD
MKMRHRLLTPLLVAALVAFAASCRYAGRAFGPKDEGGIYLVIAVKADAAQLDQAVARTVEVMRARCEQLNVYCKVERGVGDKSNRIRLNISTREDPERVKGVILSQGLELRAVVSPLSPSPVETYATQEEAAEAAGADKDVLPYRQDIDGEGAGGARKFIVVERAPIVTGRDISRAEAVPPTGGSKDYSVNFTLRPEGAVRFGQWTGSHINHYLAMTLNKEVRSVAYVRSQIFDAGQISARFTKEQAEDAALVLNSGELLAPIEALEEGVYRPEA